ESSVAGRGCDAGRHLDLYPVPPRRSADLRAHGEEVRAGGGAGAQQRGGDERAERAGPERRERREPPHRPATPLGEPLAAQPLAHALERGGPRLPARAQVVALAARAPLSEAQADHPGLPTMRTSGSSVMPKRSRTVSRVRSIRARTSAAVAPPRFTMKFPCTGEICAPPTRRPLSPAASISRPAWSPGGFFHTEPNDGWSIGWVARR